jgi:hypothetical protein
MRHENALRLAEAIPNSTSNPDFSGLWRNQMQSTMDLTVNANDVSGVYTSASSAAHGGPIAGTLNGYAAGDLISFLVLWPGGSQTAWVGQMVGDESHPAIRTLWHLVTNVPDAEEPNELWTSTYAGADEFTR